jgi:hypothetical protein
MSGELKSVEVFISVDEWRNITQWMYVSLRRSEAEAEGHFLLEIHGNQRIWVTSDGDQLTVLQTEGPLPQGDLYSGEPLTILLNSRFFRGKSSEDVTLLVSASEDRRIQTIIGDGFEMSLPEHPGPFFDWREVVDNVQGTQIQVESGHLIDACNAANVIPFGVQEDVSVSAWLFVRDQQLVVDAPWYKYPNTTVFIEASGDLQNSVPILISPVRLRNLLVAIDPAVVTLTLPDNPLGVLGIQYDSYLAFLLPLDRWGAEKKRLEELLCEFLNVESINPDQDGDYSLTTQEGNELWVRLYTDSRPITAQVFSVLASNVPCTPDLLAEVNSINANTPHVKVMWASDAIMTEVDIVAESLDISELANALTVVQETADRYRMVLSTFFGGSDA